MTRTSTANVINGFRDVVFVTPQVPADLLVSVNTDACVPGLRPSSGHASANWMTTLMSSGWRCKAFMNASGFSRRESRRASHVASARART